MTPEEYLKSGDPGKALTALQDKVRADPSNAKLRIFLFQLLCVLGDWKRAIAQLKLSAELDPGATLMAQTIAKLVRKRRIILGSMWWLLVTINLGCTGSSGQRKLL